MSAAERETPAGEAMREAVARIIDPAAFTYTPEDFGFSGDDDPLWLLSGDYSFRDPALAKADAILAGPIASELARLRAIVSSSEAERYQKCSALLERALAAEAALTTQRADHAAEVARKDAEIADLRAALEDTKAAADDLAQVCPDEHDNKAAGALQFISGFISDRFAATQPEARQTETSS